MVIGRMRTSAIIGSVVVLVGCATILGIDDGQPRDSGCPQFDLKSDPAHCGACDTACKSTEVCSQGACKAQCDAPLTRCGADGGSASCSDLTIDPKHCGACTTSCPTADAGTLEAGPNNPNIPDASNIPYDGGAGWSTGIAACTSSKCTLACPQGMTQCADGVCYDTQNFHDHCGGCTTACPANEWCALGHCCPPNQLFCNGKCGDVLADPNNCGGCGTVCSGMTPVCDGGKCVAFCTPSGNRATFNALQASSGGCIAGNPCQTDMSIQAVQYIASFETPNAALVCGGTTACVSHVGIGTYSTPGNCQGTWDVYCDSKKVGTIATGGKGCAGSAMSNGCNITFQPLQCTTIKLVGIGGSGTACCSGTILPVDTRVTAVSAW